MNKSQPIQLFSESNHSCILFNDLVTGHGVQANQFLVMDGDTSILIDPGGDLTYIPLTIAISQVIKTRGLDYIFASHQDPDIIASIDMWLMNTKCEVIISSWWSRFLPHLISSFMDLHGAHTDKRIIEIPDEGKRMKFGNSELIFIPGHFLHSVANFQLYDPVSKILFSGDMGASLIDSSTDVFVDDFDSHIQYMLGFHQRFMTANKAISLWVNMVRKLDLDMIVPQHGKAFKGKEMIEKFLNWIEELDCGVDLLGRKNYQIPE